MDVLSGSLDHLDAIMKARIDQFDKILDEKIDRVQKIVNGLRVTNTTAFDTPEIKPALPTNG